MTGCALHIWYDGSNYVISEDEAQATSELAEQTGDDEAKPTWARLAPGHRITIAVDAHGRIAAVDDDDHAYDLELSASEWIERYGEAMWLCSEDR